MKTWPVPHSFSMKLPEKDAPGAFWKNRIDRHHCGVDIYAPVSSEVLAVECGEVIDCGIFTSPDSVPYWNTTYFVVVKHPGGMVGKYAEMERIQVETGDIIDRGQIIGYVGEVLDPVKITSESPLYIQRLKQSGHRSMLHFELYRGTHTIINEYSGGNIFNGSMPDNLLDPTAYLNQSAEAGKFSSSN